jgi:hypothetical protein
VYPSKIPSKEQNSNLSRLPHFKTKHLHSKGLKMRDKKLETKEKLKGGQMQNRA